MIIILTGLVIILALTCLSMAVYIQFISKLHVRKTKALREISEKLAGCLDKEDIKLIIKQGLRVD
jgi:hypothetical protein